MCAVVASREAASHSNSCFCSWGVAAKLAFLLGEFALDHHLQYFLVVDIVFEDEGSLIDADCVEG